MITRIVREGLIIALLAAVPATVSGVRYLRWQKEEVLLPGEVHVREARQWKDSALWVDARSDQKFEHRHLAGAIHLDPDRWDELMPTFLDAWEPDKTVVVYGGREGDVATAVAHRLREELKIDKVWVLHGGIDEWNRP